MVSQDLSPLNTATLSALSSVAGERRANPSVKLEMREIRTLEAALTRSLFPLIMMVHDTHSAGLQMSDGNGKESRGQPTPAHILFAIRPGSPYP